ncbi:hypothetical protein M8494_21790 [Serratia ureilytica]
MQTPRQCPQREQTEFPSDGVEASGIETVNAPSYELLHYEIPRQVQYLDTYVRRQKETHFALTTRALNVPNTKLASGYFVSIRFHRQRRSAAGVVLRERHRPSCTRCVDHQPPRSPDPPHRRPPLLHRIRP